MNASKADSNEEALDDWEEISNEETENNLLCNVAFQCKQWLPRECCDVKQQEACCPQHAVESFLSSHTESLNKFLLLILGL